MLCLNEKHVKHKKQNIFVIACRSLDSGKQADVINLVLKRKQNIDLETFEIRHKEAQKASRKLDVGFKMLNARK